MPYDEDILIERAVNLIDSGKMIYYKRVPLTDEARNALKRVKKEKKEKPKEKNLIYNNRVFFFLEVSCFIDSFCCVRVSYLSIF